ncbi:FAD:protein FMN transferase [Gayadomonas joobiniege]|uniref:FAD:protein FMN transferase n=1 Tax=Gayadomonas joobiniege TaxID=1234606 RepID=UPI00037CC3F4|nr:FAD:protein FMN transferase [Gayadomonas joobiniege]
MTPDYKIRYQQDYASILFTAMTGDCEIRVDTLGAATVEQIAALAYHQVLRIEHKFSRYRTDNICYRINTSRGDTIPIDAELYRLLTYADKCYQSSDGLFDLTSGILRRAWPFDEYTSTPNEMRIKALLQLVGWQKIEYNQNTITMPPGMEIDFGAIAKEYAAGLIAQACRQLTPDLSILINLGGDIQITQPRKNRQPWLLELPVGSKQTAKTKTFELIDGALACSRQASRFAEIDGRTYSHILNPKTGWPVENAPSSVTVMAPNCIQAGSLATIAMLKGEQASEFLLSRGVNYHIEL